MPREWIDRGTLLREYWKKQKSKQMTEHDYDEGYRAGMQKMRDVAQARIDKLEAELSDVEKLLLQLKEITSEALKGTNK